MKTEIDETDLAELRNDKARIDWLADLDNEYGGVELPVEIVRRNIHCLRAAIDEAMEMQVNNSTV